MMSLGHSSFKNKVVESQEGETMLVLKQLTPVRMMRNKFFNQIAEAEGRGSSADELKLILGRARAKKGMFEGDMEEGELEIGQVAAAVHKIIPAGEIVKEVWEEFLEAKNRISKL